jgi:hypothetical protein
MDAYADELVAGTGFEASTTWLTGLMFAAIILKVAQLDILSRRFGGLSLLPAGAAIYLLV